MEIKWIEPPAKKTGRRGTRLLFIDELRKNPNVWALFREATYPSNSYELKKKFPNLEMTTRFVGKNELGRPLFDIYLRWVEGDSNA
jgi:hypothetical protein